MVTITYDERKRLKTLQDRGLDFADLELEFFLEARVFPGNQDGRFVAIGSFQEKVIAVIFAPLGTEGISVISMRVASRKERRFIL